MNFEDIKKWFSKKENLILFGILLFAAAIRIYYFVMTKNQPIWWDESDYLAYAKTLAGIGSTNWIVTSAHNSLLSFLTAFLFFLKFSEPVIRFVLEIVPSFLIVFFVYLICTELYKDKKIAYISSFLFAVFWELLFYSMRMHTEVSGLLFAFAAIYVFFKGYEKQEKIFGISPKWSIPISVALILISYGFRRQYLIFGAFFFVYMLITKNWKLLLKDKYNWIGLAIAIFGLILFDKLVFVNSVADISNLAYHPEHPIHLAYLKVFYGFFENFSMPSLSLLHYLFIFGFFVLFLNVIFLYDFIRKKENISLKANLFFVLSIILTLCYFMFYQRSGAGTFGETRWYYPLLLASIICISQALVYIFNFISKYQKKVSIVLLLILIGYGGYYQISNANSIIENKLDSYSGIKDAGLYLKNISSPEDIIISVPVPQAAYYSERFVANPASLCNKSSNSDVSLEEFVSSLEKNDSVKYIIVSFSEPNHPEWMRNEAEEYSYNSYGQVVRTKVEIPFMNTTINFQTGQQDIKTEMSYGNISFKLISIQGDCFIYEISRKN